MADLSDPQRPPSQQEPGSKEGQEGDLQKGKLPSALAPYDYSVFSVRIRARIEMHVEYLRDWLSWSYPGGEYIYQRHSESEVIHRNKWRTNAHLAAFGTIEHLAKRLSEGTEAERYFSDRVKEVAHRMFSTINQLRTREMVEKESRLPLCRESEGWVDILLAMFDYYPEFLKMYEEICRKYPSP